MLKFLLTRQPLGLLLPQSCWDRGGRCLSLHTQRHMVCGTSSKYMRSEWNFQHLSSVVCPCNFSYSIFVNVDFLFFFIKYSCVLNLTVIYERKLRENPPINQQRILLLATIINMLLSVLVQVDYRKVWNQGLSLALSMALSW